MSIHLSREIDNLKKKLLSLATLAEESVWRAVRAVEERDVALADKVIASDIEIDHMEVEVEEECLKILALHQPVAIDLRFIVAVLKINNDLERIGDLAVNIAERGKFLALQPAVDVPFDFPAMAQKAQSMLRKGLDALIEMKTSLAREVCGDDDEVDAMNREMYDCVKQGITDYPENVDPLIHLLCISRHLERIADSATNIAEDVIYMAEGEIVRHRVENYEREQE